MRTIRLAVFIVSLVLVSVGCARTPGGISASNIPLAPGGYTSLGRVAADDCIIYLFGLLPISGSNYIEDAENKAIRKIPGAVALVDISVDRVSKFFILWGQVCTEVHATAVRVP